MTSLCCTDCDDDDDEDEDEDEGESDDDDDDVKFDDKSIYVLQ